MQLTQDMIVGIAAGITTAALYAASVVIYRREGDEISPIAASSLKMWVALLLMGILVLLPLGYNPFSLTIEVTLLLTLSVIINAVLGDSIYLASQERIGVAYAFPISGLFPIFTYLIAIVFLGEDLLFGRLLGTVIAVVGVVILSSQQNRPESNQETRKLDWLGIGLAFLTSILYAIGTILLQVGVTDVEPVEGNFIRILYGSIAFVPIFLVSKQHKANPSRKAIRNVTIAGLFGMGIGSLMYVTSVKFLGAAISSVVTSTSPLFAVTFSVIFLKERVSKVAALSILLIVLGVVLVVIGI